MADLNLSISLFSYDAATQVFSTEASDLKSASQECGYFNGRLQRRPGRSDQEIDVNAGFYIVGRTARVWMRLIDYKKDVEGDVLYGTFAGALEGKIYKAIVFND